MSCDLSILKTLLWMPFFALARYPKPESALAYRATETRKITRRGVIWLGLTCNLRCSFCYFYDKVRNPEHREHPFISLEKAKLICNELVHTYGNNSVDIQGGEPTLYPFILELIAYCREIGLAPTLITNARILTDLVELQRFKDAGIRDFLVSIQGLGAVYDQLVGRENAHTQQMIAVRNFQEAGIPFRVNTVMTSQALPQLLDIARLCKQTGAQAVNFLAYNPFFSQGSGTRNSMNVPTYSQVSEFLTPALEFLKEASTEVNVRYLPMCMLPARHRDTLYNFPQISYDLHENDFASWSWTDLPAQRIRDLPLSPPLAFGPRLHLGPFRTPLRRLSERFPSTGQLLHQVKQSLELSWADKEKKTCRKEDYYLREARYRSQLYCGYIQSRRCRSCHLKLICDGFHGDYVRMHGASEARPVNVGRAIEDPKFYIHRQFKRVHPEDITWLENDQN